MLKQTRQTSPGEPAVGTTFVDETSQGTISGEIAEMEAPHRIVYHWWERSRSGRWFAVKERTITVDALKASFERSGSSSTD